MRLKYWFYTSLTTFWAVLAASGIYGGILFLQRPGLTWEDLLFTLPVYLLLFGGLVMMALNAGLYKLQLPLALSFGSTRNEAILGMQIQRFLPAALIVALTIVLTTVAKDYSMVPAAAVAPLGFGLFLGFSALGGIAGMVMIRFGKIGLAVTVATGLVVGMGAGLIAGMTIGSGFIGAFFENVGLHWLIFCIGVFLYAIVMIPEQRLIWKYNVKL
jgi:hypothetical protein